jgi:hypothetical protein
MHVPSVRHSEKILMPPIEHEVDEDLQRAADILDGISGGILK